MPLGSEWGRCRPWIEAALEECGGTHGIDDVEAGLLAGDYQFWPAASAACVTEVVEFPRRKALIFWLAGGDLAELLGVIEPVAREWGETQGCDLFIGYAVDRPGWARALEKHGYRPGWRVMKRVG